MKRFLAACGAALFTLALATPAFAHHVTEDSLTASSVCSAEYETIVSYEAELDGSFDATWTVEYEGVEVDTGSSDAPPNVRTIDGSFVVTESGELTLFVQFIGEDAEAPVSVNVEVSECVAPTTTTTVPPVTTTVPVATTVPTSTTSPTSPPVPPTAPPTVATPTLAETGSDLLGLLGLAGAGALGAGTILTLRATRPRVRS